MNRTLMQRLKGLPGATGNSPKNRKARKPEDKACLTLIEFERWLALEVGQRYHHSEHRGLFGSTPHATWMTLVGTAPTRQLAPGPDEALRLLIHFMPLQARTIQLDGLTIFYIRYWHPIFIVWREDRRHVRVRYHPEDLSRVYVSADGKNYVEARYADLRRPAITLWEQRAAVRALRAQHQPRISEAFLFKAIEQQRRIVDRARRETKHVRAKGPRVAVSPRTKNWSFIYPAGAPFAGVAALATFSGTSMNAMLPIWIIGAPLVFAIFDWMRTPKANLHG
jgi:putative transposase